MAEGALEAGRYRITFDTGAYFAAQATEGFYPEVSIDFEVKAADEHYRATAAQSLWLLDHRGS